MQARITGTTMPVLQFGAGFEQVRYRRRTISKTRIAAALKGHALRRAVGASLEIGFSR